MMTQGTTAAELFEQLVDALVDEGVKAGDFDIEFMLYARMESLGHGMGQELSRQIQAALAKRQQQQMPDSYACPRCQADCRAEEGRKTISSIDGDVELPEVRFHCPKCRKSFFPGT